MNQMDFSSLEEGGLDKQLEMFAQRRKQAKLAQVEDNSGGWMGAVLSAVADLADDHAGMTVTGETIRTLIEPIAGAPHHHNAWGAAISQMVRKGYLVPTERWVPMTGPKSNARKTPEYTLRPKR
jgi:hypothetical protein